VRLEPQHAAALAVRELARRATADPASFVPWLPTQWSFLASNARVKEIRAGNQTIGKTHVLLAEVIGRCVGRHPLGAPFDYPPPGPTFEAWLICDSWSQSVAIMGKCWELLPKDEIDPRTVYDPGTGFRGKNPFVRFTNGSILRFKTGNQNPKSLASGTIDVAAFDEPPEDERIYVEVAKRLQHRGGVLLLAFTPVNAPVEHLREKVNAGLIEDHWAPLTPEALVPVGWSRPLRGPDGRLRDAAWIAEVRRITPAGEAPVVIDGEWEFRAVGAYFDGAWDPLRMCHQHQPTGNVELILGMDHGSGPGKQCCYLIAVDEHHVSGHPAAYVLDEYSDAGGNALPDDDARAILAMLGRHGFSWGDLKSAEGDRVHMVGTGQQKSNRDLEAAIAKLLRVPKESMRPRIRTAKRGEGRGKGSVGVRSRWLYQQMVRGCFAVHPRCTRLLAAIPKYTGRDDVHKDPIDAVVYGLDQYTFGRWNRGAIVPIRAQ